MPTLGKVLQDLPADAPRGPDLHVTVTVPSGDLGLSSGTVVRIPLALPHDGTTVRRCPAPQDDGDRVRLHLPADLPDGATLRLVGQGGAAEGGRPGDLYVTVRPVRRARLPGLFWLALGLALGLLCWLQIRRCVP